jgi:hypothetical protein
MPAKIRFKQKLVNESSAAGIPALIRLIEGDRIPGFPGILHAGLGIDGCGEFKSDGGGPRSKAEHAMTPPCCSRVQIPVLNRGLYWRIFLYIPESEDFFI